MKKAFLAAIVISILITLLPHHPHVIFAQNPPCSDTSDACFNQISSAIAALEKAREMSIAATTPLQGQLSNLRAQLNQIQANLNALSAQITQKEADLTQREEKLATEQALLDSRVKEYYIRSYYTTPLIVLFSSGNSTDLFQELSYNQATTREDQRVITSVTQEIVSLVNEKAQLEKDKTRLAAFQVQVNQNATFLDSQIQQAQAYQENLANQIAQLNAQEQALVAAKLASLNIPRSAATSQTGCVDDRGVDPGFSPRFAFFTYGVPNRIGLNQYGAKGRADAGQNYQTILSAYYQNYSITNAGNPNIHVVGTNNYGENIDMNLPLEDYLKHIYEMPSSWNPEALKAQAVAARSYVLAATNNGASTICPSDSCQEFKTELNDGSWQSAVSATQGQVMSQSGQPIKAWFSSTHGGYVLSSDEVPGWSATSYTKHATDAAGTITSFSDLQSLAYDRASPWFYCDWGSRPQYSNTAWLQSSEVADIVNVILLAESPEGSQDVSHLSQTDKGIPDTWDASTVRQHLSQYHTPFNSVSSVTVSFDTSAGRATTVHVTGDGGSVDIDGGAFKQYFDLRAPANIQIVGPLYNIEQR